jgi:hypothetical protein
MKQFLSAARRTHAPEAHAALSAPILLELQERERDIHAYFSQSPDMPTEGRHANIAYDLSMYQSICSNGMGEFRRRSWSGS